MTQAPPPASKPRSPAPVALAVVVAVVATEYLARRVVAPGLPTMAATKVNDMAVCGAAYVLLSLVVWRLLGGRGTVLRPLRGIVAAARRWEAWAGAAAVLVVLPFALLDHALWGSVKLPSFALPWRTTVLAPTAAWAAPAALLLMNGLVVPVAEEWLWRGAIQPRLVAARGAWTGVAVTSALFSVKHALVDASLGRFLTIIAGGAALGLVARAASWKASAISHMAMNSVATAAVLLMDTSCLDPQPVLAPEVAGAVERAVALVDSPEPEAIESLLTPRYLERFPTGEMADFFRGVRRRSGHCAWQCTAAIDGPRRVTGLLACERRAALMTIGVEEGPPHKVDYLRITPTLTR